MRAGLGVVLILAAWPALAAPERSPRPELRFAAPPVTAGPSGALERSPRPRARPIPGPDIPLALPVPAAGLCAVTGLTGTTMPEVRSDVRGCGIAEPVRVTAVQGVPLSMPLVMDCTVARAMNDWVRKVLKPTFADRLLRIDVAGAYTCRGRNNVSGAKISEHGRGRAVDVSGLGFTDGTAITVARDWNKGRDGRLMAEAYKDACGIFGTTLGPGSDGYHEDHMHFDVPSNRRSPYCR